ncbi:hypothetical protein D3C86_1784120 [compost metagenome]
MQFAKDVPEVSTLITRKYSLDQFETAIQELLGNSGNSAVSSEHPVLKSAFVF